MRVDPTFIKSEKFTHF